MHDSKPPASDGEGQARDDESQPAAKICDHLWISTHQPDFPDPIYWIKQCSACGAFDGADLAAQLFAAEPCCGICPGRCVKSAVTD